MSLVEAARAEVEALPESLRESVDALLVVDLAVTLAGCEPRETAAVSRELRLALTALRARAGAAKDRGDVVDDLNARREARRRKPGGRAASKAAPRA